MSYILEALRKADAQRGQGQVPGLHDQHMAPEFSGGQAREGQSLLIWIIMAMGVLMMGLLVWALWQPGGTSEVVSTTATLPPATAAPMPQTPEAKPTTNTVPSPASATDVALVTPKATAPTPAPAERAIQPRHERKPPAEPATGQGKTATAGSDELPDLPEAMRAQLPKLAFGGAMHSDNAASRMLIVNGQLLHEGDAISPELTLERIQLKQATFRYKGYRYTAQY